MPGLRRLRDPRHGAGVHAGARHRPAQDRVRLAGSAAAGRFTYYMDTYGVHGIHGRAPAIATGIATAQPGPQRLGRDRRRRRALDRRQPPDPRAAPQREPQDPAVQQPDLRPDEGPVLADERGGQGHEVDAVRLGRPPLQPDRAGARGRGAPSWPARSTTIASTSPRSCGRPPRTAGRRSSRSTRTATCSTTARSTCCARRPQGVHNQIRLEHGAADRLRRGHASACSSARTGGCRSPSRPTTSIPTGSSCTTAGGRPSLPFALAHLSLGPHEATCIGVFREVERPVYGEAMYDAARARHGTARQGRPRDAACTGGDTWTVG